MRDTESLNCSVYLSTRHPTTHYFALTSPNLWPKKSTLPALTVQLKVILMLRTTSSKNVQKCLILISSGKKW
ncbi:unnamed protein product [Meloidogyne enterolobii]|uniref:Uncharacterized protein n=1 Tax=Meloidogyne enterolobii TaxID=390850 RepID=A0ACB1A7X7_MELEN